MKLRNKIAAITAAAMLAFTGVGFAAWTFTKTIEANTTATSKVTCGIEANNLSVYNGSVESSSIEIENIYVVFDAPTTADGNRKAGEGIFYCTDLANPSATKIKTKTLKLVGQIDHIENDLHYNDIVEEVEFRVTETNSIPAAQVSFSAGSIADSVQDVVVDDNEYEAIYTLPKLDYVAAPTTLAELTAFGAAVSGKTISLVFTFGIKA